MAVLWGRLTGFRGNVGYAQHGDCYRRDLTVRAADPRALAAGGAQPAPGHRDHESAKREIYDTLR